MQSCRMKHLQHAAREVAPSMPIRTHGLHSRNIALHTRYTPVTPGTVNNSCHVRRRISSICQSSGDGTSAQQTSQIDYVELAGMKVPRLLYFAIEIVVFLGALAIIDGGYSGDWTRIGVISKSTEQLLQKLSLIIIGGHIITGGLAARLANSRGLSPIKTFVLAFLFGSLELNRVTQLPEKTQQSSSNQSNP